MAADNDVFILRHIFHRLFVPHVFFGESFLSSADGGMQLETEKRGGRSHLPFLFKCCLVVYQVRYCRMLEEENFRGRTAYFVTMIMFGVALMTAVAPFVSVHFLGSSLSFMMVYVWGRRNEDMRMLFLAVFAFNALYLSRG